MGNNELRRYIEKPCDNELADYIIDLAYDCEMEHVDIRLVAKRAVILAVYLYKDWRKQRETVKELRKRITALEAERRLP